jgi:hypothetical protein
VAREGLEVADVFRRFGPAFREGCPAKNLTFFSAASFFQLCCDGSSYEKIRKTLLMKIFLVKFIYGIFLGTNPVGGSPGCLSTLFWRSSALVRIAAVYPGRPERLSFHAGSVIRT